MTQPTDIKRAELIAGLRQLADWYEQHPEVPLPPYPDWRHCVLAKDDTSGTAEVEAVAAALGADVKYGKHVAADKDFPGIEFHAYYVTRERAADYVARQKIADAATPEQLTAVTASRPVGQAGHQH